MSLDISRVRFEPSHGIGRLLYRRQGLLLEWGSFVAFLRSDFARDGTRIRNFRHGLEWDRLWRMSNLAYFEYAPVLPEERYLIEVQTCNPPPESCAGKKKWRVLPKSA